MDELEGGAHGHGVVATHAAGTGRRRSPSPSGTSPGAAACPWRAGASCAGARAGRPPAGRRPRDTASATAARARRRRGRGRDRCGAASRRGPAPRPAPRWPSSRRGPRRRWRWGRAGADSCRSSLLGDGARPRRRGLPGAASGARGRWALTLGHISPSDQGIVQRCRAVAAASGGCSASGSRSRRLVRPRARGSEPGQQGDLLAAPHRHLAPPRDRCHEVVPRLPRPRRDLVVAWAAPAGRGRRAPPGPGTARARRRPPSRRGSGSPAGRGGARPPRDRARRRHAAGRHTATARPGPGGRRRSWSTRPGRCACRGRAGSRARGRRRRRRSTRSRGAGVCAARGPSPWGRCPSALPSSSTSTTCSSSMPATRPPRSTR